MLDISILAFNSVGVRYGTSKLFQILLPLVSYVLIRDVFLSGFVIRQPSIQNIINALSKYSAFKGVISDLPVIFEQSLGLMSWKIGCDLGFFLIVGSLGPWERAFTWAGLIPYTIIQYFLYYLIGRKMLIEGEINPFKAKSPQLPSARPSRLRQLFSKYFHEDLNVTSENIPLRQVILKPFVDYFGLVASWSIYTIGMFFIQSGELSLAPLTHFAFFSMATFYLVNTYGYIIGFNLGELLYVGLSLVEEYVSSWRRQTAQKMTFETDLMSQIFFKINNLLDSISLFLQQLKYVQLSHIYPLLERYGLNLRWVFSVTGGIICITLLAPNLVNIMMSISGFANQIWFETNVDMNSSQLLQIQSGIDQDPEGVLPDSNSIVSEFPEAWTALYLKNRLEDSNF